MLQDLIFGLIVGHGVGLSSLVNIHLLKYLRCVLSATVSADFFIRVCLLAVVEDGAARHLSAASSAQWGVFTRTCAAFFS